MAPQRAGRDITKQMLRHRQIVLDQAEFKQKAEEKKMSMSKNIARLAVTAGLTAALSFGGVMAPVTMAFAEGGQGSITINQVDGNQSTTFKAYQIFKATVTDTTSGKTAQDITWASSDLGTKVTKAIKNDWAGYKSLASDKQLPDNPTAQEVADFLMAHAENPNAGSTDGKTKGTRVATDNILYAVANAVKGEKTTDSNITAGQPWNATAGSGYYLFVTDESSLDTNKKNTGTSPIFAVVGGSAVTVYEKTNIPTVEKKVLDDSKVTDDAITGQTGWDDYADSQIGQEVNYKLTGTIADNYDSYDSYSYKFKDQLSNGLDYAGSLEVYALNGDQYTKIATSSYNVDAPTDLNQRVLTVSFIGDKGLKSATPADESATLTINASTKIVVFYKAKLNSAAVVGNNDGSVGGNPNTVKLEYSNNPFATGTGTSVEDTVADFTFKLNLNKVDQGTEKGLKGAVFTIQSNDSNTAGKYVASQDDTGEDVIAGQLVSVDNPNNLPPYVMFTSNDKGEIAASGLDAGSYTVHEVSAPSGSNGNYTPAADFTFTIKPTYNSVGTKVTQLQAVSDDSNRKDIAIGNLDNITGDNQLNATDDPTANASAGAVTITIGNTKSVGLPLTGLNGVTFTWIAGGAVLCIGVAHLIRSRKQAEESEQE